MIFCVRSEETSTDGFNTTTEAAEETSTDGANTTTQAVQETTTGYVFLTSHTRVGGEDMKSMDLAVAGARGA